MLKFKPDIQPARPAELHISELKRQEGSRNHTLSARLQDSVNKSLKIILKLFRLLKLNIIRSNMCDH